MLRYGVLLLCATAMPAISVMAAENRQSAASYEAAIRGSFENVTSAPAYVMLTIVDANTGVERLTCSTANLLAGAIDREYALAADGEGRKQALSNGGNGDRPRLCSKILPHNRGLSPV